MVKEGGRFSVTEITAASWAEHVDTLLRTQGDCSFGFADQTYLETMSPPPPTPRSGGRQFVPGNEDSGSMNDGRNTRRLLGPSTVLGEQNSSSFGMT